MKLAVKTQYSISNLNVRGKEKIKNSIFALTGLHEESNGNQSTKEATCKQSINPCL